MSKRIDNAVAKAQEMLSNDHDRDLLYQGIDDMWHGKWEADSILKERPDFREVIDLSPHDALRAGSTLMSTILPKWSVQPYASNPDERARAEKIEYVIDWHFKQMNRRNAGTILWDMAHSSIRYDAIAIWLDYLPYWVGKEPKGRAKYALRNGPFAATVYNPQFVHTLSDTYGPYNVLYAASKKAQEVANYWVSRDKKQSQGLVDLLAAIEKNKSSNTGLYFSQYDNMYWDGDKIHRIVWGSVSDTNVLDTQAPATYVLMDEDLPTPFMNWIVKTGGSSMETENQYSVHPLLAPLYWSHKWQDQNSYESIVYSEIIKYARSPRTLTETPNGEGLDIDFENGSTINARTGLDKAEAWTPAPIDANLKELIDRGAAAISSATLPKILQNPEFAGNTPFASINAIMQTAANSLNNAKILCENSGVELAIRMLEWASDQGDNLSAYRKAPGKSGDNSVDIGDEIILTPDDYHPDHIIIDCTFSTELVTDYMQKLNAAVLMVEHLDYPKLSALEDIGKTNPDTLLEQRYQEKYDETTVAADLSTIAGDAQLSIQAKQMQLQMQAQQAQMQQQQQAQQQQQQAQQPPANPAMPNQPMSPQEQAMMQQLQQGGGQGQEVPSGVPQGQGYNPNAGGMSPAVGNPAVNNRETVNGTDYTGRQTP